MFQMKFMDGTPVPENYARLVGRLVQEAAEGDPGEAGEAEVLGEHQQHLSAKPDQTQR